MKLSTIAPAFLLGVAGSRSQVSGFAPSAKFGHTQARLSSLAGSLGAQKSGSQVAGFIQKGTANAGALHAVSSDQLRAAASDDLHHVGIVPESLKIQAQEGRYPTLGNGGISYRANIDGIDYSSADVAELQSHIWKNPDEAGNQMDFLPKHPTRPLSGELKVLSDLAAEMPVKLEDGSKGLLAKNQLRKRVMQLDKNLIDASKALVEGFKNAKTPAEKQAYAQEIQSLSVFAQWLIRGVLFEGPLHKEPTVSPVVPSPLSVISAIANQATGLLQKEFVYHSYTLLPAELPVDLKKSFDELDYNDPKAILDAIASIKTLAGFNDIAGHNPEHNFRFNHVLMEYQMRMVFEGYEQVKAGDNAGMDKMIEGYRRAHKVFETMLMNTPAESYPQVRLPITAVEGKKGVADRLSIYPPQSAGDIVLRGLQKSLRGDSQGPALMMEGVKRLDQQLADHFKTKSVFADQVSLYPPQGVLYEGLGSETVKDAFTGKEYKGERPPPVPGQTGANSSMYKLADVFIQVAKLRQAYEIDDGYFEKLTDVMLKQRPYTELGKDPIDSMMLAFDVFTRPDQHQQALVETYEAVNKLDAFQNPSTEQKVKLLEVAYWVAKHRLRHGQYVNKAIFSQPPKANQSRAEGTGGSTIQFLKRFFDDTLTPSRNLISDLKSDDSLSESDRKKVLEIEQDLAVQEEQMVAVDNRGRDLARQEGKGDLADISARRLN